MKRIFKIKDLKRLKKIIFKKKVIVVGGCFDIVHLGHLIFLEKAKKKGDFLIVFLESDESIRNSKGVNRPINNQKNRALFLSQLRSVDAVICLPKTGFDYQKILNEIKPNIVAVTQGDINLDRKKTQIESVGGKLIEVSPQIPYFSTSRILEMITPDH